MSQRKTETCTRDVNTCIRNSYSVKGADCTPNTEE